MERKLKLKKAFDTDYDDGEGAAASFYDDLKKEVDDQESRHDYGLVQTSKCC